MDIKARKIGYRNFMGNPKFYIVRFLKSIPDLLLDFRNSILVIIIWIIISEISGNSVFYIITSIFRLIIYPINWFLFRTSFELTEIPEVFLLFIPLMLVILLGFLTLISTED